MSSVVVNDSAWRDLVRRVSKTHYVKVGVLGQSQPVSGEIGVVELATMHEMGLGVPERSFIRRTFREKQKQTAEVCAKLSRQVVTGKMSLHDAHEALGLWASAEVKKTVTEGPGVPPPLAESTIARKGSTRPLIDTGRMIGAITHEVVEGE